jgi:hypothetical protein
MWPPGPALCTWPWSSTPSAASWLAGRFPGRCALTWPWTPSRWPSGAARPSWRGWSITRTGQPIPVCPPHRTLGRGGSGHLGGLARRQLRQRPGRDDHRAVQDRTGPPAWPLEGLDEVEYATLEWVDWFNHRRLLEPIGHVPGRVRGRRPSKGGPQPHRRTQEPEPPMNPGRFSLWPAETLVSWLFRAGSKCRVPDGEPFPCLTLPFSSRPPDVHCCPG